MRPLEGLSLTASFFESSPIPSVYGNFAKFVNSQGINLFPTSRTLNARFNESAWTKNQTLSFR